MTRTKKKPVVKRPAKKAKTNKKTVKVVLAPSVKLKKSKYEIDGDDGTKINIRKTAGVSKADEKYRDDFESWKAGQSPLSSLAKKNGVRRRDITKVFIRLAGSKDAFRKLREAGAGGKAFGGKRGSGGGRTKEQRVMDDSKVKTVKSNGEWKQEIEWEPRVISIKDPDAPKASGSKAKMMWRIPKLVVFVSPKGNRYVLAKPSEKADLLVRTAIGDGWPPVRMKRLEKSAVLRKVKQEDSLIKRGQKAQAAKKKAKVRKQKQLAKLTKK